MCKSVPPVGFASKLMMATPEIEQKEAVLPRTETAIVESESNNLPLQDKPFCLFCQFMAGLIEKMLENEETEVGVR